MAKKKVTKKVAKKVLKKVVKEVAENTEGEEIGEVFSYFAKIKVAAIKPTGNLKIGDKIKFKGATTDFEQAVKSMQIEGKIVESVKSGDDVGIKVKDRVRPGDKVYLVK